MTKKTGTVLVMAPLMAVFVLVAGLMLGVQGAGAAPINNVWLGDGATGSYGAWTLPQQGVCRPDPTQATRPECLTLRLPATSSAQCTALGGSWATSRVCNDPATDQTSCMSSGSNRVWNAPVCALLGATTSGACGTAGGTWIDSSYCNNALYTDSGSCASHNAAWLTYGRCVVPAATTPTLCAAVTGSTWFNGVCAVDLSDVDRVEPICEQQYAGVYPVTGVCAGNWIMPPPLAYSPPMLTLNGIGSSGVGGDLCLRCHNTTTEWNSYEARYVNDYLDTLHKPNGVVCGRCHGVGVDTVGSGACTISCTTSAVCTRATNSGSPGPGCGGVWDSGTSTCFFAANSPTAMTSYSFASTSAACTADSGSWTNASPPYSITTGLSSHNTNMTSPDASSGYCTNPLWGNITACTANGGQWLQACSKAGGCSNVSLTDSLACLTPGTCSNVTYTNFFDCWNNGATWTSTNTWTAYSTQATCLANSGTWNNSTCTVGGGTCGYATAGDCTTAGGMWLTNGTTCFFPSPDGPAAAACAAAGKTWTNNWTDFDTCDDAGICSNTTVSLSTACSNAGGSYSAGTCTGSGNTGTAAAIVCTYGGGTWDSTNRLCTNVTQAACLSGSGTWTVGKWTGTKKQYGPSITSLCMQCHRQETAGVPNENPGMTLKVGRQDNTVKLLNPAANGFGAIGNEFLNSPHGLYTGTFAKIGSLGWVPSGTGYLSYFQLEDQEVNGVGAGCTGCHNPHKSVVNDVEGALKPCQECHAGQYVVDLTKINHLATKGTPLDPNTVGTGEAAPCIKCHMPDGMHMFRINADANYSTFPASVFGLPGSPANANSEPDPQISNAVWVDIDAACGQCHGGGNAHATTKGSISSGSNALTVADGTGFAQGTRIKITGAGPSGGDLQTYVQSVSGTSITLVGDASTTISMQSVEVNPVANGAPYYTKATLAGVAEGMHSSAGVAYVVNFTTSIDSGNPLKVNVNAQVDCSPSVCPSFVYSWDWGDTNTSAGGPTNNHTYAAGGIYSITLTVKLNVVQNNNTTVGTKTRSVNLASKQAPPVVGSTCTPDLNKWMVMLTDSSTGTGPLNVVVDWGDGSLRSVGAALGVYNHTYGLPGTYTVSHKVIDNKTQAASDTCGPYTFGYYTISGTVKDNGGTPLASATVVLSDPANWFSKTVYTSSMGTFSFGGLRPSTYTLSTSKTGYTFPAPLSETVGPMQSGIVISANP